MKHRGTLLSGQGDRRARLALRSLTANGHKLWSYTTGAGVYSSPTVVNGVVYVGSEDNNIYAIGT